MKLTIKQLMEIHGAMEHAIKIFDANPQLGGMAWHELIKAKSIVRSAIEETGAAVEIQETANLATREDIMTIMLTLRDTADRLEDRMRESA